jgi:ABC-type transport system substrate-binding protein
MEAAILIQNALKKAGVEMTIDTKEFNSMTDMLRKKQFEAVLGGWAAGLFVDPSTMWHSDTPEKKYPFNYTSYSNPDVDALIEQGLATPDPQAAAPIWKDLQAKIYEDQPYLFLWWRDEIVGIDNRFENVQIDVLSLLNNLHEWEVPADKVKYNF